jgi:hypothetical protein
MFQKVIRPIFLELFITDNDVADFCIFKQLKNEREILPVVYYK